MARGGSNFVMKVTSVMMVANALWNENWELKECVDERKA